MESNRKQFEVIYDTGETLPHNILKKQKEDYAYILSNMDRSNDYSNSDSNYIYVTPENKKNIKTKWI